MLTKLLCEFGATALMIIFGVGVHCDTVLKGTKYQGSGHMFAITTWSFGISVCLFVFGGAVCIEPAWCLPVHRRLVPWSSCIPFMIADMLGGFVGAVIAWLMYADEFKVPRVSSTPLPSATSSRPTPPPRARTMFATSSARLSAPSCSLAPSLLPLAAPARTF